MSRLRVTTMTMIACVTLSHAVPRDAWAQQSAAGASNAPSAADLRSAAEAYDQATRRYMRHDYVQAANWFEAADRLSPSMLALMGAIRAHRQIDDIGNIVRAATLTLRLQARYPDEPRARALAQRTMSEIAPRVSHVRVSCDGCEIEIDGVLQSSDEFYVAPGAHRMRFRWSETQTRDESFEATGNVDVERTAVRPPAPPRVVVHAPPEPPPPPPAFRFHPAVPIVGAFVTVGFVVGTAVSWVTRSDVRTVSSRTPSRASTIRWPSMRCTPRKTVRPRCLSHRLLSAQQRSALPCSRAGVRPWLRRSTPRMRTI